MQRLNTANINFFKVNKNGRPDPKTILRADGKRQEKLGMIEAIRGFAALAVCLFHFTKTNVTFHGSSDLFRQFSAKGWIGVEAFFVVSGFIIPYSLIKGGYKLPDFFKFFAKRCLRIEPPYLLSVALVIILGYISTRVPGYSGEPFAFNTWQTLSHVAYLPEHLGFEWLLPVYWSLEAEFHYYIFIGLVLPLVWRSTAALLLFFSAGLALSFVIPLYLFDYMPLFIMGIATCAYKLGKIGPLYLWLTLAACISVSVLKGQPLIMPLAGLITSLLIGFIKFQSAVTDFLGKISFSLYLLHVPVGGRVLNYGGRYADTPVKVWILIVFSLVVTIAVSWVFYKIVEYPSQRLSKRIAYNK